MNLECQSFENVLQQEEFQSTPSSDSRSVVNEASPVERWQNLPPMLQQYVSYKEQHPDCLILFQVGDFYECFFEDAVTIASVLSITLTSRSKTAEHPIPMAGVPIAVVESYSERLVNAGFSVALVSQCSEPSSKGMVERRLDKMITPGIRLAAANETSNDPAYIAGIYFSVGHLESGARSDFACAWTDVRTGTASVVEVDSLGGLVELLGRVWPKELVIPSMIEQHRLDHRTGIIKDLTRALPQTAIRLRGVSSLPRHFIEKIKGYSLLQPLSKRALQGLLSYVDDTLVNSEVPIHSVSVEQPRAHLNIDSSTRRNLEIVENSKTGGREGSLLGVLDKTKSAMGARLVRQWLVAPSAEITVIQNRLACVRALLGSAPVVEGIRSDLSFVSDVERLAARLEMLLISPREFGALRDSLLRVPSIRAKLMVLTEKIGINNQLFRELAEQLHCDDDLASMLDRAFADEITGSVKDGGYIRDGFDDELDRIRGAKEKGTQWLAQLESKERDATGISSLKIKYNGVLGYFFEVTKSNLSKVPDYFIPKQSTANSDRFFTPELKDIEKEVLGAESRQVEREKVLLDGVRQAALANLETLRSLGSGLATVDVLTCFANIAAYHDWCEPSVIEDKVLLIEEGRHPVLANILGSDFVANDVTLKGDDVFAFLVTGPNMGGKSTYLRQIALLVILAQAGSYVPARAATIGVVDRIFARIGAADDLMEGESTFMVEMREASHIVSNSTERSLVLVDELGRGTATADGMALAQSILEWIVNKSKSRCLFATHYHDLTSLTESISSLGNLRVAVYESDGTIVFTHEIQAGAASKSYGFEVARMAGMPTELVERAEELAQSSEGKPSSLATVFPSSGSSAQLSLFDTNDGQSNVGYVKKQVKQLADQLKVEKARSESMHRELAAVKPLVDAVRSLPISTTTPLKALQLIAELQEAYGS